MIKRSSPGKARDILVACRKRKGGNGIWSIARELMRPYSTIRGWLVRMAQRGLGGRFDRKSTGRKKIPSLQTLKKALVHLGDLRMSLFNKRARDLQVCPLRLSSAPS